jgi:hypothetical protein
MVTTLWVSERLPLVKMQKARSPGCTKVCIFRQTFTWSYPELVRESEAMMSPSCVMMPRQYVIHISGSWLGAAREMLADFRRRCSGQMSAREEDSANLLAREGGQSEGDG